MNWRVLLVSFAGLVMVAFLSLVAFAAFLSVDGKNELEKVRTDITSNGGHLKRDAFDLQPGGSIGDGFEPFRKMVDDLTNVQRSIEDNLGRLHPPDEQIGAYQTIVNSDPVAWGLAEGTSWQALQEACQPLRESWSDAYSYALTQDIHYIPDYLNIVTAEANNLGVALAWARVGNLLALLEIQRHDLDQACLYLEQTNTIFRKVEPLPCHTLLEGLVQMTVDAILMEASRMILNNEHSDPAHLDRIRILFSDRAYFSFLAQSMAGERIFFGNWVWELMRQDSAAQDLQNLWNSAGPLEAVLSDIFLTCFYRPLLIDKDQAFYMNYLWQIEQYAHSASQGQYSYVDFMVSNRNAWDYFEEASLLQRIQTMVSTLSLPALKNAVRKYVWTESAVRQLQIAIALERFHQAQGHYPDSLDSLTTARPLNFTDPITGTPMVYRLSPERGYVLYSRGEDGLDDGGPIIPRQDDETTNKEDTAPDWVWPRPSQTD